MSAQVLKCRFYVALIRIVTQRKVPFMCVCGMPSVLSAFLFWRFFVCVCLLWTQLLMTEATPSPFHPPHTATCLIICVLILLNSTFNLKHKPQRERDIYPYSVFFSFFRRGLLIYYFHPCLFGMSTLRATRSMCDSIWWKHQSLAACSRPRGCPAVPQRPWVM